MRRVQQKSDVKGKKRKKKRWCEEERQKRGKWGRELRLGRWKHINSLLDGRDGICEDTDTEVTLVLNRSVVLNPHLSASPALVCKNKKRKEKKRKKKKGAGDRKSVV